MSSRTLSLLALAGIAIAFALRLPSVKTPFFADDLVQLVYLETGDPGMYSFRGPLDLFRFLDGDAEAALVKMSEGDLPWRFDREQRFAFCRPLSSALMALDHALFGFDSVPAHAHSLLWFGLYLAVLFALYRSLLGSLPGGGLAARVAVLAAALSPASTVALSWWAARNALLAPLFVAAALLFHHRWCEAGRRTAGIASAVCMVLALMAGESGIQAIGYVFAYTVVRYRAVPGACTARLWPAAVIVVLYLASWAALGYGSEGNALYVSPIAEPRVYLGNVLRRYPSAVVALATGGPGSGLLGGLALAVAAALFLALRDERRSAQPILASLLIGSLLALVPCFGRRTALEAYTLVGPQIGMHGVLGVLIAAPWHRGGRGAWTVRVGALMVMAVCLLWPARRLKTTPPSAATGAAMQAQFPQAVRAHIDQDTRHLVFVSAPVAVMPVSRLRFFHRVETFDDAAMATLVLCDAGLRTPEPGDLTVTRTTADTLVVRADRPIAKRNDVFRFDDARPYEVGETVLLRDAEVEVAAVEDRRPVAVRVTLSRSLDSDEVVLLVWVGGHYRVVTPPPVGSTISLP